MGCTNIRSRDGKSYEIFVVSNFDYRDSSYGYIKSGNEDYIFSQGTPTARMPGSGIAQYVGQAAFVRNGEAGTGDSRFTADFAAKTLNGTITSKSSSVTFTPVNINATINGNSFATASGAAVSSGGHFYGDNARELGGLFSDTVQRLSGSFGAIRQEHCHPCKQTALRRGFLCTVFTPGALSDIRRIGQKRSQESL